MCKNMTKKGHEKWQENTIWRRGLAQCQHFVNDSWVMVVASWFRGAKGTGNLSTAYPQPVPRFYWISHTYALLQDLDAPVEHSCCTWGR
jgi:hypothetical protein